MASFAWRIVPPLCGPATTLLLIELYPPADRTEALVQVGIGLLVSVFVTVLADGARLSRQVDAAVRRAEEVSRLIVEEGGSSAAVRLLLDLGETRVPAQEFPRFYLRVLWSVQRSYHTTFVASRTEADYGYNEEALRIQSSKVDAGGVDIRRLFVCRDRADVAALREVMLRQVSMGIKVRYILQDTIRHHQLLRSWHKKVGVLDFSIIDGVLAMTTDINPSTFQIRGARLTANREARDARQGFFDLLWAEARMPQQDLAGDGRFVHDDPVEPPRALPVP